MLEFLLFEHSFFLTLFLDTFLLLLYMYLINTDTYPHFSNDSDSERSTYQTIQLSRLRLDCILKLNCIFLYLIEDKHKEDDGDNSNRRERSDTLAL